MERGPVAPQIVSQELNKKKLFLNYALAEFSTDLYYSTTCHSGHLCKEDTCSIGTANPSLFNLEWLFMNFVKSGHLPCQDSSGQTLGCPACIYITWLRTVKPVMRTLIQCPYMTGVPSLRYISICFYISKTWLIFDVH